MDKDEIIRRSIILHAYFEGKNWDKNEEFCLKRDLILNRDRLLPKYPFIIEDEWEVIDNLSNCGRGDLVFTDGEGSFAVVEVKWLDLDNLSKTAKTRRESNRKKRNKVIDQADEYARIYWQKLDKGASVVPKSVDAFYYTNELDCPRLFFTYPIISR
jgi:hypothetical protein